LADLASAALAASLTDARRDGPHPAGDVAATRLAGLGRGRAGARDVNYVGDVQGGRGGEGSAQVTPGLAAAAGAGAGGARETGRATATMKGISDLAPEPSLWEVDANLRPEGKDGALVRTLESHVAYYERWAQNWEFQALLKSRHIAGDRDLGERYEEAIRPFVWRSSSRDGFVQGVQRMRERVTEHIPAEEVDIQLKLGPGGIR